MILRIVGPSSTPVWREMAMRLLAVVPVATGSVRGVAGSSPVPGAIGAATRVLLWEVPRWAASASRARNSAVGALVMLSVRAISRGVPPSPGLATNRIAPADGGAPVAAAAISGTAGPPSIITLEGG